MPSVHLRERKLKDGVIGFYLDFYVGGSRYYETLDIKIRPEYDKEVKKALRDKATSILYSKRSDILVNKHPEVFKKELQKGRGNFFILFEKMREKRMETSPNTHGVWLNTEKLLEKFHGSRELQYRHVTLNFCQKFLAFLRKYKHPTKGNFANSTILTYYRKFQSAVKEGHKMGLIKEDYSSMIKHPPKDKRDEITRDTLTIEEIRAIKETPFYNPEIKNAFLFACFTGLRVSDLRGLLWKNISQINAEDKSSPIYIVELHQKKTKKPVVIPFTQETFDLIGKQRGLDDDNVFTIPDQSGSASRTIRRLIKRVESPSLKRKKITFHSARHTFGTMCVNSFGDLYTTQRLMGHSDHKSTIGYAQKELSSLINAIGELPKI
jgi:integrase